MTTTTDATQDRRAASVAENSWASSPGSRRSMQSNRSRDTRPEIQLRSRLHRAGLRFRKHRRPVTNVRCVADVVFPALQLAVFLDGCWWHLCPLHGSLPKTNRDWWERKLRRNAERDEQSDERLTEAGWTVLRVWEHEPIDDAVQRILATVQILRSGKAPPSDLLRPPLLSAEGSDRPQMSVG